MGIVEDFLVARDQTAAGQPGGSNQDPIGGISVKTAGQRVRFLDDGQGDVNRAPPIERNKVIEPPFPVPIQVNLAALCQARDLRAADG